MRDTPIMDLSREKAYMLNGANNMLKKTVIHFVGVVVTVFWTSNTPKENRISVNILSKE